MKTFTIPFFVGLLLVGLTLGTSTSCNKDKVPTVVPSECPDTIFYSATIEPMIQQNCATSGCHNVFTAAGGYDLEGHANVSANATDILNVIKHEGSGTPMPYLLPKLNDTIIQQFKCWMDQGKLNN